MNSKRSFNSTFSSPNILYTDVKSILKRKQGSRKSKKDIISSILTAGYITIYEIVAASSIN
jgi:hypothetical protein